ncbi:MAG: cytochrome c5 family protein [Oleispira sp.]|nr:cytochrome c5 family protein [Oleispira sp.]MBL4881337.1 cytochrome c5 family protein [Oleispira sp.]
MPSKFLCSALLLCSSYTSWAVDPFTVELYESSCTICHGSGIGDAPKSFDVSVWSERLAKGNDVLLANIVRGINGMPPLGMCSDCTKQDFVDLIDYMSTEKP